MVYDPTKDPKPNNAFVFGRKARAVTPHDDNDLDPYAKIVVLTAGTLVVLPMQNDDGDTITFGELPVGYVVPFDVRRVLDTGTTAGVATIDQ